MDREEHRTCAAAALLGTILLAAGCAATTPMPPEKIAAARTAVAESPSLRKNVIADCTTKVGATDDVNMKLMADLARTPLAEFPRIACERITKAWIDGTLNDEAFQRMSSRNLTAEDKELILRIMTGLDTSR